MSQHEEAVLLSRYVNAKDRTDWASRAFVSVYNRGFHVADNVPDFCRSQRMMAQFVRLVEEVMEWAGAIERKEGLSEAADICIVAANMGAIIDCNVADAMNYATGKNVSQALDGVARALRSRGDSMIAEHALGNALRDLVAAVAQWARLYAQASPAELVATVEAKLRNDEQRGVLHQGVELQ